MSALSRRDVLRGLTGAGLLAVGAACAPAGPGRSAAAVRRPALPLRRPGSRPYPTLPPGTDTIPQVRHIVVLMMENHSYDNHFGMLDRGDGFSIVAGRPVNSCPDMRGRPVQVYQQRTTCQTGNRVSQSWDASHECWNGGRMDGFARTNGSAAMAYWTAKELPFYWSLAGTFTLCDRYFSSVMAQTYPNRRFLVAASAFGMVSDLPPSPSAPSPRPDGFGTIFDVLNRYRITWRNYFTDLATCELFPYVPEQNPGKLAPVAQFFADAAAGTLPGFCIVDPDYRHASEENPQDVSVGQRFSAQVIDAVMASRCWPNTVLVHTYDEGGGYYDHVPPARVAPPDGMPPQVPTGDTYGDQYSYTGFRVPTVVVSPFSRPGAVSSTVYDHTSILKLVQTKWNLPSLSYRDANANDMLDCLDLRGASLLHPPPLVAAQPPASAAACIAGGRTAARP